MLMKPLHRLIRLTRLMPIFALGAMVGTGTSALAQADEGQTPSPLSYFTVQAAGQGAWRSQDAKVEALRDAALSAQVAGAITSVRVRAGEHVKAGQELLRIDSRMASQGAAASAAQVAAAQAQLAVASKEYERQQQLFTKRYISQAALDNAKAQWQASQAQVRALQAQAGVASTQSGLHTITAPFAGVVASVPATQGDMAMPGGKPLVQMYDPSALRITAALSQAQAQQLQAGVPVQVELPDVLPQRLEIAPEQVQILPTADPLAHTVPVRVLLPTDLPQRLTPGMFARLWWQGQAQIAEVLIPQSAVIRRAELVGVYVKGHGGQPLLRQVRLGRVQGEMVQVLSGLQVGDAVALEPIKAGKVR